MTILMIGMQDSLLVLESSNTGWNSWESLIETNPQSIAFDPLNSGRAYCATFGNGLGELMMVRLGVTLERMLLPVLMLCEDEEGSEEGGEGGQ